MNDKSLDNEDSPRLARIERNLAEVRAMLEALLAGLQAPATPQTMNYQPIAPTPRSGPVSGYMGGRWVRRDGDIFQPAAVQGSPNAAPNKDRPV